MKKENVTSEIHRMAQTNDTMLPTQMDKKEMLHILGGILGGYTSDDIYNCPGNATCAACKKGCKDCRDGGKNGNSNVINPGPSIWQNTIDTSISMPDCTLNH